LVLPADHASHPDYKIEWWYYTGNLDSAAGRRFGYQLTFFRIGIDPAPVNPSRWAVRDVFMTHLAVTDVNGKRFQFTDRANRAGPGWAGASTDSYRVWNEDWLATLGPGHTHRLHAAADGIGVDLELAEDGPAVRHGVAGYSQMRSDPSDGSSYYSLTRMPTRGTITIDGRPVLVTGQSWMDHEFGSSMLEPDQIGWDWFSIQLSNGDDLMLFQLRRADGAIDPHSAGTLVAAPASTVPMTASQFHLAPGRTWLSDSGARYPIAWDVRVPGAQLDLHVAAAVENQELRTTRSTQVTYWEGAIDVTGTAAGKAVTGRGYLEMTGYTGHALGAILR
jgi:predicted secreted hydrolase